MELQTGEFPGSDRSPVAFIRTCVVSQFATIATTALEWKRWTLEKFVGAMNPLWSHWRQ